MPNKPTPYRPPGKPPAPLTPRAGSTARGYTSRWQRASKAFLSLNPLCAHCKDAGRLESATVVDHVKPHKGDEVLFWDEDNWQPLCKRCHDAKTAKEDGGFGRATKGHTNGEADQANRDRPDDV